ncbi:MAG: hypothetical protein DYG84_03315 [Candidatus Brocadia sp. AMX3]|nr:hypothetical protein [Candidatus Brocadia sp. AMX3]
MKRFNIPHPELNCFVKINDYKHSAPVALFVMNEERTCHPYGVLNFREESYGYKHVAPLALTDIYGNNIARQSRNQISFMKAGRLLRKRPLAMTATMHFDGTLHVVIASSRNQFPP